MNAAPGLPSDPAEFYARDLHALDESARALLPASVYVAVLPHLDALRRVLPDPPAVSRPALAVVEPDAFWPL